MMSVLIVIHLLMVIALVGVVLLQRSEGGALGTGGGGGFMTGRGQANALSRATAILGDAVLRLRAADVDHGRLEPHAALGVRRERAGEILERKAGGAEPARPAQGRRSADDAGAREVNA